MKKRETKSSNEIMLLVDAIKNNRGLNNLQAVSFLAGLLYSYASQENIEEIFQIVSKEKVGVQMSEGRADRFDEYLNQIHEEYSMGWLTFTPSQILFNCDPIAYRIALSEFEDLEDEEDEQRRIGTANFSN